MTRIDLLTNPMTTAEDLIVGGASGAPTRLAAGSNDEVLTVVAGAVAWAAAGAGSGAAGNVIVAFPPGFDPNGTSVTAAVADRAYACPIFVPGPMKLRGLVWRVSASAAGSFQWGLFDYSASPSAATKLAGGSAAFGSTGYQKIDATSAPVTVAAGNYMLVGLFPASSPPTLHFIQALTPGYTKSQDSYTWDDTPDFTTGWTSASSTPWAFLKGDLDGSGTEWW
jgi:hypothetical protein